MTLDASKCEKCGSETFTASLYRYKDKLYCSNCLPIVHCHRCGVNTYTHGAKGPDDQTYCTTCLSSICAETNWRVLKDLAGRLEAMASSNVEAEPLPEHPSRHLRIRLPFVTVAYDESDGMIDLADLSHCAAHRAQEAMQIGGLINWFIDFIRGYLDGKSEARARRARKCDGNHAEPACADPQCWCRS